MSMNDDDAVGVLDQNRSRQARQAAGEQVPVGRLHKGGRKGMTSA